MDLTKEINKILTDYCKDVDTSVIEVEAEVASDAVKKLKQTSPKKKKGKKAGHYAKSWDIDKKSKTNYAETIIYNKDYQLTHLLENGHDIIRNGKVVGHADPQPHIKPVGEWVQDEMVKRLEKKL